MAITIDLVISKYNEDVSWLTNIIPDINKIIYSKLSEENNNAYKKIPNVGREGQTYLYHIVNNYNNLSEYTVFCQANPFDHSPNLCNDINNLYRNEALRETGFYGFGDISLEGPYGNFDSRHNCGLPMFYFLDLFFDIKMRRIDSYYTIYGAQFAVHKDNILVRPIEFYKFLLKIMSYEINPIEGFILERLWPYIMDKNISLSNKITYLIK